MESLPDRMQIPEYVRRELSEVYLLMDHIAGRQDKSLDQALAASTTGGTSITLEQVCAVAWPPTDQNRAQTLALVLTAKDRLSHAAFPATAYSIAFTYLSLTPDRGIRPKGLHRRLLTYIRNRRASGSNSRGSGMPASPTIPGGPSVTSGREDNKVVGNTATASTMVQFAQDAFPSLEAKREWLVEKMTSLVAVLLVLLVLTCIVSWDLAIGQRLLADYRWLSLHPDVMQIDSAQANSPCPQRQPTVDQGPPASPAQAVTPNDANAIAGSSKIKSADLCARFLAGMRVLPLMERWISQQLVLAWFIQGHSPPSEDSLTYQGYILELQRVLVTTLNYDVLPLSLGALAATAAALRNISRKTALNELEPRDLLQVRSRILLGAFLGAVIGLLISPGASNGLFALAQTATLGVPAAPSGDTGDTVALSPAVYAFFAGFATGRIFNLLDNLLEKIFVSFGNSKR